MRRLSFILTVLLAASCGSGKSRPTTPGNPAVDGNHPAKPGDGNAAYSGNTIVRQGRFLNNNGNQQTNWAGASFKTRAQGTQVVLKVTAANTANYNQTLDVFIDGQVQPTPVVIRSANNATGYPLSLPDSTTPHLVEWRLRTEASYANGPLTFIGIDVVGGQLLNTPAPATRQMEFIGDSISNGYGVLGTNGSPCSQSGDAENSDLAYGPLTAAKFGADFRIIASSGRGVYRNRDRSVRSPPNVAPLTVRTLFGTVLHAYMANPPVPSSTELAAAGTYTAQSDGWAPAVVVINLGTNDFSRRTDDANNSSAIPDEAGFVAAYAGLMADVRAQYPGATIVPCLGPMLSDTMSVAQDDGSGNITQVSGQTDTATQPLSHARTYINEAISAARAADASAKITNLIEFPTEDTTMSACDAHPSAAVHAAMAAQLHDAIVAQGIAGWTN